MGAPIWSPSPRRSGVAGGAVAALVNPMGSQEMGPRYGPQAPRRSGVAGGAVAALVNPLTAGRAEARPAATARDLHGRLRDAAAEDVGLGLLGGLVAVDGVVAARQRLHRDLHGRLRFAVDDRRERERGFG